MRTGDAVIETDGVTARAQIVLEGSGACKANTGSAFLDHMLNASARTGGIDLNAKATGDTFKRFFALGSAIGTALDSALQDRRGIRRYGWACVPMDDALCSLALDLSGRPYLVLKGEFSGGRIGDLDTSCIGETLDSFAVSGRITIHITFYGENDHHKAESIFKALGLALKQAVMLEGEAVPSTKGII